MIRKLENHELENFRGLLRAAVDAAQEAGQSNKKAEQFIYTQTARTVLDEAMGMLGDDAINSVIQEHIPEPAIGEITEEGHAILRLGPGGDFTEDWPTPRFAGDKNLERAWKRAKAANERLQKSQQLNVDADPEADRCPTGAVAGFVVIGFFAFLMGAALATIVFTI